MDLDFKGNQTMPHYRMIVHSCPHEGRDAEFNDWYQNEHLVDIVNNVPGFISATRFQVAEHVSGDEPRPYLAIYDIEAPSAKAAKDALIEKALAKEIRMSDSMDESKTIASIYEVVGNTVASSATLGHI